MFRAPFAGLVDAGRAMVLDGEIAVLENCGSSVSSRGEHATSLLAGPGRGDIDDGSADPRRRGK
jgi:hypothetical protein